MGEKYLLLFIIFIYELIFYKVASNIAEKVFLLTVFVTYDMNDVISDVDCHAS